MVNSFISAFTKVLNIITYKTNVSKVQNIRKVISAIHLPLQTVSNCAASITNKMLLS